MKRALLASAAFLAFASPSHAKEGMYTPDQLPEIAEDLQATGLELDPQSLTDLTSFPMGAVISLGGCTASFVSPEGLVVTNHHCARGSVQYNSTEEKNYLEDGFLAATKGEELKAAPGSRVYVTVDVKDVTDTITSDLGDLTGKARYDAIDLSEKELIAECEAEGPYRCQVGAFFGGMQYKLIKRLEIRDVRLVYAPGDNIGKYGGDIDNWMWPRHTGDFSFYRAYVGQDGKPADYSEDNIPFQPEHYLKVSAGGLEEGDFVMAAGYPGSTNRYERLKEVEYVFDWYYPTWVETRQDWIDTIIDTAPEGSDMRIKYESRLAGLNNYVKNRAGQLEGARRVGLKDLRAEREAALDAWIAEDDSRAAYGEAIAQLDALTEQSADANKKRFWYAGATTPALLDAAQRLYRLSVEQEKPDAERESGYQERDLTFIRQRLEALDRRYDPTVDKAEWMLFLEKYMAAPEAYRVAALDEALGLGETFNEDEISARLDAYYAGTTLGDTETRVGLIDADKAELEALDDPFMQLAIALFETEMAMEAEAKERAGQMGELRSSYMEAIIGWQKSNGVTTYPDANSTLRVTYGTVMGGSPKDGLIYTPFTSLEGITEKDSGVEPFNAPQAQLDLIEEQAYGEYALESLGSVPVNFLSDLDSTGGNSGSPTLNGKGELVGLLFDGTLESVNADWHFDPKTTRTIHVDSRYMLWVMEKVSGADNLIEEMTIVSE